MLTTMVWAFFPTTLLYFLIQNNFLGHWPISIVYGILYPIVILINYQIHGDLSPDYYHAVIWVVSEFATISHFPVLIKWSGFGVYALIFFISTYWLAFGLMIPMGLIDGFDDIKTAFVIIGCVGFLGFVCWRCQLNFNYEQIPEGEGPPPYS